MSEASSGNIGQRAVSSSLNTVEDPDGHNDNTAFVQVQHAGTGVEFGSGVTGFTGSYPGVRFYSSPDRDPVSYGAGVYVIRRGIGGDEIVPMVDATYKFDRGQSLSGGVGTDGTLASSYVLASSSWKTDLQTEENKAARTSQHSAAVSKRLSAGSSVYARSTSDSRTSGNLESFGIVKRIGGPTLTVDSYSYTDPTVRVAESRLSLFVPLRRQTLTLQCLTEDISDESGVSERPGLTNTVSSELYSRINPRTSLWQTLSVSTGATGRGRPAFDITIGFDRKLSDSWQFTTQFDRGFNSSELSARGAFEYIVSDDLQLKFLYGPKIAFLDPGLSHTGFGFQIVKSLDYDYVPSGSISGRIFIEGETNCIPIQVAADGDSTATCNSKGGYSINHVELGQHEVEIVPASLPADISCDEPPYTVDVEEGQTVTCNFHLHRVGEVDGTVTELPDQLGHTDPSAIDDVVIRDDADDTASTDINGAFSLSDLRAGKYTVSIDPRSLPSDYEIQGSKSTTVTIVPGQPTSPVQFTIMPAPHQIDFDTVPAAPAPANSTAELTANHL